MLGRQDIYWQNIIDIDKGIFSKSFVEAFCPELTEEVSVYREMARTVYRECSEYTHGNFRTHRYLPEKLEFNKIVFEAWHDIAETARIVILFAFCVRYLFFLDRAKKATIEPSVMEHLGHVIPIRAYFEGPKEGDSDV